MANKTAHKNSRQLHRQPQSVKRKSFMPVAKKMRIVTTVEILVCIIAVLTYFIMTKKFAPDQVAQAKLEEIARDYYENYYYDKFTGGISEDESLDEAMKEYEKNGFPGVYLRHLLVYDDEKNKTTRNFFDTKTYVCDENKTMIKFIPFSPYGKKDYKISYTTACNYK